MSASEAIEAVDISGNLFTALVLPTSASLKTVDANNNKLTSISVLHAPSLETLDLSSNAPDYSGTEDFILDLTGCDALQSVFLNENPDYVLYFGTGGFSPKFLISSAARIYIEEAKWNAAKDAADSVPAGWSYHADGDIAAHSILAN